MADPISDEDLDIWRRLADEPGSVHLTKSVLRRIIARLDKAEVQASETKAALWRIGPNVHTVYADEYRRIAFERDALRTEVERHRSEPLIKSIERILDEYSAWIAHPCPEVTKDIALAAGIAGTEANRRAASEHVRHLEAEVERLRAALAQSDSPCAYCTLPADRWAECTHGFPGCARADDAMGCPELGARLELDQLRAEVERLRAEVERLKEKNSTLMVEAGWAGEQWCY